MNINKIKQINFTVLYGVVKRKTKKNLVIDYGTGKIKVSTRGIEELDKIQKNYTISVSGFLRRNLFGTYLEAQQIALFDKKPLKISLED